MKSFKLLIFIGGVFGALFANQKPHLNPEKLLGGRFSRDTFKGINVAVVGYCPTPSILRSYNPQDTTDQYFLHLTPASVQICEHNGVRFLSLSHVYGCTVGASTIEELAYYGIKYVLAYGLAGGLGTKDLKIGDAYLIETAYPREGATKDYTDEIEIPSTESLNQTIEQIAKANDFGSLTRVKAAATDAIYREHLGTVHEYLEHKCDVANCEASHIFAVSREVGISATQCGIVSNVIALSPEECDNNLGVMMSEEKEDNTLNPMDRVNDIIKLYVENVMPTLK